VKLFNRMIDSPWFYVAWYVWVFVLVSVMAYAILAAFSGAAR
jgi:hypothetical protein